MSDYTFASAAEIATAIRTKRLGSREALEACLARIERVNPAINAVVTLDIERARARADAADAAVARGETLGPLHGVPMTVKDTYETAGLRTTAGAPVHAQHVPAADATAVARLVTAGAVIFGKTNTPVFAMDVQTYNPLFGTTNNPWNLERTCGGSSGGAAAALASGMTPLELGSDIGGSIRTPANFCGVYGHKPSFGIVPMRGHIPGPPGTLSETDIAVGGPLARTAGDLRLALDILAGPDRDEAVGWRLHLPQVRHRSLRKFRVAAWLDEPACAVDAAVRERLEAAVESLRQAGVAVDDRARPGVEFSRAIRIYFQLLWAATAAGMPREVFANLMRIAENAPADDDSLLAQLARGSVQRHRDWLSVSEAREKCRARWAEFFQSYDVLLCPVTPTVAIPHDHNDPMIARTVQVNGVARPYVDLLMWVGFTGMAFLPSTVAPVGRTQDGMPVGVQIVGPYLEDRTTIEFARQMADVVGGFAAPALG